MQQSKEGGFRQRFSNLLQNLGGRTGGGSSRSEETPDLYNISYTEDVLEELGPTATYASRLRALKELQEVVASKRLEQNAVQALWLAVRDLLEPTQPVEARHHVLHFLRALVSGQYEYLNLLRAHFFNIVAQHQVEEDFKLCFDVIGTLTNSGRNIQYLEHEMGPFLTTILPRAMMNGRSVEYLTMLVNMIKHNASYLDEDVLEKLVHGCCRTAVTLNHLDHLPVIELCLDALNAIVCYSCLPPSSLSIYNATLCHTLHLPRLLKYSLEMMLRLLGTHAGYTAVHNLCSILKDRQNWGNPLLLRGAVFYLSMSLWGVRKVESLNITFASILPALEEVSLCSHTIVLYEIGLSLTRLVGKYGTALNSTEWIMIYNILATIQTHVATHYYGDDSHSLVEVTCALFESASILHSPTSHAHSATPTVDLERFYSIVEQGTSLHKPQLVLQLLSYRAHNVCVGEGGWIDRLKSLIRRYYLEETMATTRKQALILLEKLVSDNILCFEDELIGSVILPLLSDISEETDSDVCCDVSQFIVFLLDKCGPKWAPSLLAIVNNVLQRDLEMISNKSKQEPIKTPCRSVQLPRT